MIVTIIADTWGLWRIRNVRSGGILMAGLSSIALAVRFAESKGWEVRS